MAQKVFYVKFETLISGTTPLYLSTKALSGSPANEYVVVKRDSISMGGQSTQTLEGTTEFPTLSFECVDPRQKSISAATDATALLSIFSSNSSYLFSTRVSFYEGDDATTYSSFAKTFTGYVTSFNPTVEGFSFECQSLFKFAQNPVVLPTGSFQISTQFDWDWMNQGGGISIKNPNNVKPPVRSNLVPLVDGGADTTAGWVDTTGTGYTALTFNTTAYPPSVSVADGKYARMVRDVAVGTGPTNAKRGCCYTLYGYHGFSSTPGGTGGYVDTDDSSYLFYLIVQGLDGSGNVIDSERTSNYYSLSTESATPTASKRRKRYIGIMYPLVDPRVVTIRLIVEMDTSGGGTSDGYFYMPSFSLSNTWLMGREIVDILDYNEFRGSSNAQATSSGRIMLAARAGCGSLPTYHAADEEAQKITVFCGHPADVARRLLLTPSAKTVSNFFYNYYQFSSADVSAANDTIAIANHGFKTGQLVRFTTATTLPAPLATATDYWLIVTDTGLVKVASSLANAQSGTAINITSTGTGPHQVGVIPTDAGTDTIQSIAHGYKTGQAVQFITTNTLPAGLSASTTYYLIVVDQDSFKVATSAANAYSGTAVNITDSGTGFHSAVVLANASQYNAGDGIGLGDQFSTTDIGSYWDTLTTKVKTGTLYAAWSSGTNYNINACVSNSSKNWRCRKDNTSVNTVAPAEGDYWEEIGNYFDGENWRHYKMMFLEQEKIENAYEWITTNICKPLHVNLFESTSSVLDARDWRSTETAGGGVLTSSHRVYEDSIPAEIDRSFIINKVTYRLDFDPMGTLDIQGNQNGNNSTYAREYQFDEFSMGHEHDGTTARSVTKNGLREFVIEGRGIRGAHSARFGFCHDYGGDQLAYEVSRRLIQRYGDPVITYQWKAVFSKRTLDIGDAVTVTHANMIDIKNGVWGRSSAVMTILEKNVDFSSGTVDLLLRADADVQTSITNDTSAAQSGTAGATTPGTPTITYSTTTYNTAGSAITYPEFSTTSGTATDEQSRNLPVYPKDYSRIVWLKLAAPHGYELLVYRYSYGFTKTPDDVRGHVDKYDTAGGPPPTGNDNYVPIAYVGEIPVGSTDFYFVAVGNNAGNTYLRLRFQYRTTDRAPGPITALSSEYTNTGLVRGYGNRGGKSEIRQVNGSGQRGSTVAGQFTSYGR